jgi:hypothetical protein
VRYLESGPSTFCAPDLGERWMPRTEAVDRRSSSEHWIARDLLSDDPITNQVVILHADACERCTYVCLLMSLMVSLEMLLLLEVTFGSAVFRAPNPQSSTPLTSPGFPDSGLHPNLTSLASCISPHCLVVSKIEISKTRRASLQS